MADTIILEPELLLATADPADLRRDVAIAVRGDRIAAIDGPETLRARWPNARIEPLPGCLLLPGLVNAHQHGRGISQIQLGYSDDLLEIWINSRRGRGHLDPYPITKLAALEMLGNGVTTTVHANYAYGSGNYEAEVRAALRGYDEAGIRVTMCIGAMDRGLVVYPPHEAAFLAALPADLRHWLTAPGPPLYAGDGTATVALMGRLLADYAGHPRIRFCYGPAGPQWVSDQLMRQLVADAEARQLGLHLHALESPAQTAALDALHPGGTIAHLDNLGVLGARTVLAHGVWAGPADIEIIARRDAIVVRNPGSNLRVRSGIAPLADFLAGGVRLAIGTDNTGLADDEDLLLELRLADLLARQADWRGAAPPGTADLLAMATVNGAAAAQIAPEVGTLEPGAGADLTAVSLDRVRTPYLDPDMPILEAFLARARGADVRLTMVDGRILYRNGEWTASDRDAARERAAGAATAARRPRDSGDIARMQALRQHLTDHYRGLTNT